MNIPKKVYIGDSVYAEYDGFSITLTTWNGYPDDPRNKICLEPEVLEGLFSFVESIKAQVKADRGL